MSRHTADCKGNSLDDNCDGRCSVQQPITVCPVHDTSFPTSSPEQWVCRCSVKIDVACDDSDAHAAGCDCGMDGDCAYRAAGFINMCPGFDHNTDKRYFPFTNVNPPPVDWKIWRRYTHATKKGVVRMSARHTCSCTPEWGFPPVPTRPDPNCPAHGTARALTETYGDPPSPPLDPIPPAGPPPGTGDHARIICETAADLVNGDRNSDYGDALDNFTETAALWSPIFGIEVTAEQVALCMNQLKVARLIHNSGHRDSWIDGVGYLALGGGIARRREQS